MFSEQTSPRAEGILGHAERKAQESSHEARQVRGSKPGELGEQALSGSKQKVFPNKVTLVFLLFDLVSHPTFLQSPGLQHPAGRDHPARWESLWAKNKEQSQSERCTLFISNDK